MKKHVLFFILVSSFYVSIRGQEERNPFLWPFSDSSIWNMPLGNEAEYIKAFLQPATASGLTIDEDLIVMMPKETMTKIYKNNTGWGSGDRCVIEGGLLFEAPIPAYWEVSPDTWDGRTPNSGLAVLMPDGQTIRQTQPFARCTPGEPGTSLYNSDNQNIYGDGYFGSHGGSGLSAIGGALRAHELLPNSGNIRHALKINVYGAENLYYDSETRGYRWPAKRADGYASNSYYTKRGDYPVVQACRMGSLLALPPHIFDTLTFESIPGQTLAKAFMQFGAYIVDDTAWDVYAIVTEWGPDVRFVEEFEKQWGFSFETKDYASTPWARDIKKIFDNLHVVNNNVEETIGGPGDRLGPMAPAFANTPPIAKIKYEVVNEDAPYTVTLDGSGTSDREKDSLSFSWFLQGNLIGTHEIFDYVFDERGDYTVSLTVNDGTNNDSTSLSLRVGGDPKLTGVIFGTANTWCNEPPDFTCETGNTSEKAFDGDLNTFFDPAPYDDYVEAGIDLGNGVV